MDPAAREARKARQKELSAKNKQANKNAKTWIEFTHLCSSATKDKYAGLRVGGVSLLDKIQEAYEISKQTHDGVPRTARDEIFNRLWEKLPDNVKPEIERYLRKRNANFDSDVWNVVTKRSAFDMARVAGGTPENPLLVRVAKRSASESAKMPGGTRKNPWLLPDPGRSAPESAGMGNGTRQNPFLV